MHDTLKHRCSAGTQRDHAEEQRQRKQYLIFLIQTQLEGLPKNERNNGHCRDREADSREC